MPHTVSTCRAVSHSSSDSAGGRHPDRVRRNRRRHRDHLRRWPGRSTGRCWQSRPSWSARTRPGRACREATRDHPARGRTRRRQSRSGRARSPPRQWRRSPGSIGPAPLARTIALTVAGGRWWPSTMKLAATRVGGEQLPDHVRMTRQQLRAAVAEMRRQRRAGSDGVGDLLRRRRRCDRCATRTPAPTRYSISGERARHLGRERDQHDAAVSGLLAPLEVVDARADRHARADARRAARPRGDRYGPFHVNAGDRPDRASAAMTPRVARELRRTTR